MGIVTCLPGQVNGEGCVPPSKSAAHRALIAAALGNGRVEGIAHCADIDATLQALAGLGIAARVQGDCVSFSQAQPPDRPVVDCRESGSTLRFLIPLFSVRGIGATFVGQGRLPQRPLGVYADCLPPHGLEMQGTGGLPLTLSGRLAAGEYALPGDVSSQFLTGLLFALPLCDKDSILRLTTPLESAGYVDMTLRTLRQAGIRINKVDGGWEVPGGQTYRPVTYVVEKDWSQAAFFLAAGAIGGRVAVRGLDAASAQGDRAVVEILRRFGAGIDERDGQVVCRRGRLTGITIDAAQIPDLVPILAVVGAYAQGETRIVGGARLRIKESDRLSAVADGLRRLGADVTEYPDGLAIRGGRPLKGGFVRGYNDHRIVMSMAVAALGCIHAVSITDPQSVDKSWPTFFSDFGEIGGQTIWHR